LSLGIATGSDGLDVLSQAVNAAVDAGKIVVVAAGNSGEGPETVGSPGAAEKAITVGAVSEWSGPVGTARNSDGVYLAPFSSRGPTLAPSALVKPGIAAPGVSITSADAGTGSGYSTFSGTSMATPFTAGTIALMLDADPTLTYADITGLLQSTAQDRGPAGKDNHWGWGLIDSYALVSEATNAPSYSPTIFPSYASLSGSVAEGGMWSHTFVLTEDDLDVPIAATVLLDGVAFCALNLGPFGCFIWEWAPDLEARLRAPNAAILSESTCPAGSDCGGAPTAVSSTRMRVQYPRDP
jgi:serine protease AprX